MRRTQNTRPVSAPQTTTATATTTASLSSVGVIGLGPAGLATVKEFLTTTTSSSSSSRSSSRSSSSGTTTTPFGFDVVRGFDRCCRVGGRWSLDRGEEEEEEENTPTASKENTKNAGVWHELCTNTTRRHMEFSDFPWTTTTTTRDDGGAAYPGTDGAYGGLYPHCTETGAYLAAYARQFQLYPHLHFNTEVLALERLSSSDSDEDERETTTAADTNPASRRRKKKKWKLITTAYTKTTTRRATPPAVQIHYFDAIVICNGPQAKAFHPLGPRARSRAACSLPAVFSNKLTNYTGQILHSQDFCSVHEYTNQRVLVIGSNVSGCEIASLLAEQQQPNQQQQQPGRIVHSVRKMPYHVQKFTSTTGTTTTGTSFDDHFFLRAAVWCFQRVPEFLVAWGLKQFIYYFWPDQCDAAMLEKTTTTTTHSTTTKTPVRCAVTVSADIRQCGVTVTKNYVDLVQQGLLPVVPEVDHVVLGGTPPPTTTTTGDSDSAGGSKRVRFVDGTTAEFDVIICATGYDFDLSLLPSAIQDEVRTVHPTTHKNVMKLYKNTLVPHPRYVDNLAFCGLINSLGPYFPQAEMQARYIAAIWSRRIPCPTPDQLHQHAARAVHKKIAGATHNLLHTWDIATVIQEELGTELGVTSPGLWTILRHPRTYLFRPVYSCFYRCRTNPLCQQRFDHLIATCPQHKIETTNTTKHYNNNNNNNNNNQENNQEETDTNTIGNDKSTNIEFSNERERFLK